MGILHLGERQRVRLFVRRDTFGRFLSCLVFVPRDRFNTENRRRIEAISRRSTRASIDYTTRVSESVLVRLHYMIYIEPGHAARRTTRARSRSGSSPRRARGPTTCESALVVEHGEERGTALRRRYGEAFPAGLPRRLGGAPAR